MGKTSKLTIALLIGYGIGVTLSPYVFASRNASGTHSLPAGHPFVTGTTISASTMNTTMSDFSAEITDSLSRSGKGPMTAALELVNGSVGTPAISFDSDTDCGLYRIGTNNPGMSAGGSLVQSWATTGSTFPLGVTVTQSQAATAGLTSTGNTSGAGLSGTGGASDGTGVTGTGGATNGYGVVGTGTGSGRGGSFTGGTSDGTGVVGIGGATNGPGCSCNGTGGGVGATASNTTGGYALVVSSDTTSPVRSAFRIIPQDTEPTGANAVGDMYVTSAGVLKICTVAGTPGTFVSVGAQ